MYQTEKEFELETSIESKIIHANENHLHANMRKSSSTKSNKVLTRNSYIEHQCKRFQPIPAADLEYIIIKTLAPDKKPRALDTKVLNQLPNINILTSAYGCAILNDIKSADKPEQIKLQEIHRNYNLHFGIKRKEVIELSQISIFIQRHYHQIFSE